ncbi:MAG: DUF5654 family protein [Patescibacteria group bacterium]|nr:DUF5654 family protein [Patescibacteria group bacterium]
MDKNLKLQILEQMSGLVTAGLGLVAALAWNEAIKKMFEKIFGSQSNLIAMFGYAVLVTVLVVILSMRIGKLVAKLKSTNNANEGE